MGIWIVLSGIVCLFIAYLADKCSKNFVADAMIFIGIFIIALETLL